MKDNNIASLKKQINNAIEDQDFEKVELLSEELGALLNLDESDCEMPEDFLLRIKQNNKEKKHMNMKKIVVRSVIAAAVIVLSLSGTTIAKNVRSYMISNIVVLNKDDGTMDGFLLYDPNDTLHRNFYVSETQIPGEESMGLSFNLPAGGIVFSVDKEINAEEFDKDCDTSPYDEVEYATFESGERLPYQKYKNLESYMIDYEIYNIFETVPTIQEPFIASSDYMNMIFEYGSGHIHIESLSSNKCDDFVLVTRIDDISNIRDYKSKSGTIYQLIDSPVTIVESSKKPKEKDATFLLVGHESQVWIFSFIDMTEDEIHEFIDTLK